MPVRVAYLILLNLTLSFAAVAVKAQSILKVADAKTLQPIDFATIQISEANNPSNKSFAYSNHKGEFEVKINGDINIKISHVGYATLDKNINTEKTKTIWLQAVDNAINEVVVTGNAREISIKETIHQTRVIDRTEIESRAAFNLRDVLMNELNIQIEQDPILGTNLSLQGLGGNDVKIMIDGVPVIGRLNGNVDLSQINLNNIERIEIVEGPMSVMYGTNAIAGVINLITKKNQEKSIEASVNTFYESSGQYNIDGLIGIKKQRHFLQLSGGRYFFDGWHPGDFDRRVSWNPKEQYFGEFNYVYRTKNDWFHKFRANIFQDKILNRFDPFVNVPTPFAFDDWYRTNRNDFSYIAEGAIGKNITLNSTNAFNNFQRTKNTYVKNLTTLESELVQSPGMQDTTLTNQWMSRTYISFDDNEKKYSLQAGYDANYEIGRGQRFQGESGGNASILDIAGFFSMRWNPIKQISIQPGIRYSYNSRYRTLPTPSVGLKYDISQKFTYRFSYGMGFRAPSLRELYLVFNDSNHNIFGNTNLEAESSHNINSSLSYADSKNGHNYNIRLGGFFNYKFNAIALASASLDTFTYLNINNYTTAGIQIDANYQYKEFSLTTGFSMLGIPSTESINNSDRNDMIFYPQLRANLAYDVRKIGLNISLFNRFTGARDDFRVSSIDNLEQVERIRVQSFHMMDLNITKSFWQRRVHVNAGIRNLLNITNLDGGLSTGVHSSNTMTMISMGRTYFVGLKFGTGR